MVIWVDSSILIEVVLHIYIFSHFSHFASNTIILNHFMDFFFFFHFLKSAFSAFPFPVYFQPFFLPQIVGLSSGIEKSMCEF